MNAIELLKQDHQEASNMLAQLEGQGADGGNPDMNLFNQLKNALTLHTEMEEQIFYPALENFDETREQVQHAYKEHKEVDGLLARLSNPGGDWQAGLSELKSNVEHHVREEETDMFPKALRLLGEERLRELGERMRNMKRGQPATA
jgi:small-conductance mechanosensitive channel